MPNGPLRPHRVCIRITGLHYVELDAVNAQHAEGQAELRAFHACGLPSGSRVDPSSGDVTYPIAEPAKPVEVRLDRLTNIRCDSVEEKPIPPPDDRFPPRPRRGRFMR